MTLTRCFFVFLAWIVFVSPTQGQDAGHTHGRRLSTAYSYDVTGNVWSGDGCYYCDTPRTALKDNVVTDNNSGKLVGWARPATAGEAGRVLVTLDAPGVLHDIEVFWAAVPGWGLYPPTAFSIEIIPESGGANLGPFGPFSTGLATDCTAKTGSLFKNLESEPGFQYVNAVGAIVRIMAAGGGQTPEPGACSSNFKIGISEIDLNTGTVQAGAGGDPHFKTWKGDKYDFHGHCDLVLLHTSTFGDGQGLSIHIRSSPLLTIMSYISDVAIRIGENVLEVGSQGHHTINGVAQTLTSTQALSGYPVTSSGTKKGRYVYKIHLDSKETIILREYKSWITLTLFHASEGNFGDSVGLMGSFQDGTRYGRDGMTVYSDIDEFGQEWQVKADIDGLLFQTPSPYPNRCNLPSKSEVKRRGRRLQDSMITRDEALLVCAHWGEDIEDCVIDVQLAGDLTFALNQPI